MSIVERVLKPIPGFEIVNMKVRKGREILVMVDLNTGDPTLAVSVPRNLRAELDGMLSCEEWNKKQGEAIIEGRFNFKTGEITTTPEANELTESQSIRDSAQRFVRRATRLDGANGKKRKIITREPEKHSDNHPIVTGHNPESFSRTIRRPNEKYHIWEVLDGQLRRPVIPSGELKAPVVTPTEISEALEDSSNDLLKAPHLKVGSSAPHTNGVLPKSNFKVQEIAAFIAERR